MSLSFFFAKKGLIIYFVVAGKVIPTGSLFRKVHHACCIKPVFILFLVMGQHLIFLIITPSILIECSRPFGRPKIKDRQTAFLQELAPDMYLYLKIRCW